MFEWGEHGHIPAKILFFVNLSELGKINYDALQHTTSCIKGLKDQVHLDGAGTYVVVQSMCGTLHPFR